MEWIVEGAARGLGAATAIDIRRRPANNSGAFNRLHLGRNMRIWSLHPKYLDGKGLVALWRETLLARQVLVGKTRGYRSHPQLKRFRAEACPIGRIDQYLAEVYREAAGRGYHFDKDKVHGNFPAGKMTVTRGQLKFETAHLLKKLKTRDAQKHLELASAKTIMAHPLFTAVKGGIEEWEKVR